VVLVVWGCSPDDPDEALAAASSSTSTATDVDVYGADGHDGHTIDDLARGPFPDLPEVHESCEERGARFGFVINPVNVVSFGSGTEIRDLGIAGGPAGMVVMYTQHGPSAEESGFKGIQIGTDGEANGSGWSVSGAGPAPAGFAREGGILITNCSEIPWWRAYNENGSALGQTIFPAVAACTGDVPAAAWTDAGYLVAWHATPYEGCPDGCIMLAKGTPTTLFSTSVLYDAFIVTDPLSIAVASEAALVVASHVNPAAQNELAMTLIDHGGDLLFPPMVYPFDSAEPRGPQGQAPVAVGATPDDGYVVLVGGRGGAYGRVELDTVASVVTDFEETPLSSAFDGGDAFRSGMRVASRTGGFVLYGPATQRTGIEGTLLLMLDRGGALESELFLPGATTAAVVTREGRTFLVYADALLRSVELGCVL